MTMPDSTTVQPVLLFDGHCNLCNFWVNFLLAADSKHKLKFATQQSTVGKQPFLPHGYDSNVLESVILIDRGIRYSKSAAILKVLLLLGGFWSILYVFVIVPRPIRDFLYDFIARRRYRWFGKRDQCRIPTAQEQERFLD